MSETVIVSVLSLLGTALGSLFGVIASARLTNYRLSQLEKKVELHNHLVERMSRAETRIEHIEKEVHHA